MDLAIPTTSRATTPKKGRKRKRRTILNRERKPKDTRNKVEKQVIFEIEKILRKAEFVSSGGETKYLVSWPNTWEPEDNLSNCPELLEQFEAGLPQIVDIDDDNIEPFPSEWVVEKILDKRNDENGEPKYLLRWQNSWLDGTCIRADLVQDYEDEQRFMAIDAKNASRKNNNNNDNNIDGDVKKSKKRKRSTNEMSETEPRAKKSENGQKKSKQSKLDKSNVLEIETILRKAEFVSTGGETKYLVSWPNTWEPDDNLSNCPELIEQFEAGLPQSLEIDDDDDDQPFPSEWIVEQILDKRYRKNGKVEYFLKWRHSWVNATDIRADQVQDYEEALTLQRRMAMDAKNASCNNNNNDIDGVEETMKRNGSTSTDEMSEMEPSANMPESPANGQKRVNESNGDSPKVIEMELITLSEQRKLDRIIDIGKSNDGSFSFMLKFETGQLGIIKRQLANIKYPQEVIAFYQRRIQFS